MVLLFGMIIALPGLVISAIAGIAIWRTSISGTFRRMLAVFALKPWITTPLFLLVASLVAEYQQWIFTILPGLVVTIILVRTFAPILRTRPGIALLILAGDAARWILATAVLYAEPSSSFNPVPPSEARMPVLIWTSLYAVLCWGLAWYNERQEEAPAAG